MDNVKILWADDEIDLLKMHVLFLEEKGHTVVTTNNGDDAVELVRDTHFDLVFLDENMPGLSGIETLKTIKSIKPTIPVVMITKSEEENIMEEAIGSKIADYLIKPVNPNQILLTIKKNVDKNRIINQKTTSAYQQQFSNLGIEIGDARSFDDWVNIYKKLVFWNLELSQLDQSQMEEVFQMQRTEANNEFAKYIKRNYQSWFSKTETEDKPLLSPSLMKERVLPLLKEHDNVVMLMIDNLRYDQWKALEPLVARFFQVTHEELFCSILPTATQYARNAIFSGLMPSEIEKLYPDWWLNDVDDGGKNMYESQLLEKQLTRFGHDPHHYYEKIMHTSSGSKLLENLSNILDYPFAVIVYNFIDMLSHARTEMQMIRELANDEAAYRSLTVSWFEHSALLELLQQLAERNVPVVITTDHGSLQVKNPVKVVGDRTTNTNLRYKQGKNLKYKKKEVYAVTRPQDIYLPHSHLSSTYIFALNNDFFAYPNNYNHYAKYYKDTFQHGGVSLEEMLIPYIVLKAR